MALRAPRPPLPAALRRLGHPQTTVRWRLTLLYGALFLISGAALLAITYTLVDNAAVFPQGPRLAVAAPDKQLRLPSWSQARPSPEAVPGTVQRLLRTSEGRQAAGFIVTKQRSADLHQLIIESGIALALMALLSAALGWVVAGRVLRPLRVMTTTAREISEESLNRRLAMSGPRDELHELADTIDGLLGRLEGAFDAQRRFVANASHELRTPLTAVRALLEMVLSDPGATVATFRVTCEQVLEESGQQEQLIDALLTLAQGQRGIDRAERFDLAAVASGVLAARESAAAARGVTVSAALRSVMIAGDARLAARLAANLIDNAICHNLPGGWMSVEVAAGDGAVLTVTNTGPVVPAEQVSRLAAPFARLSDDRTQHGGGLGLGLSIVAAVADAHGASLNIEPRAEGGLAVAVNFPAGDPAPADAGGYATWLARSSAGV